jgi:hypothetical protein
MGLQPLKLNLKWFMKNCKNPVSQFLANSLRFY